MKINTIETPIDGIAMSACGHPELSSLIGQNPTWATPAAGAFIGAGYGMRVEQGQVSLQADAIKVKSLGIRAWSCSTT